MGQTKTKNDSGGTAHHNSTVPRPGEAGFTQDIFLTQAYSNGWDPRTDKPALSTLFNCYQKAQNSDGKWDADKLGEILDEVMFMSGQMEKKRTYILTKAYDTIAGFEDLDDALSEQLYELLPESERERISSMSEESEAVFQTAPLSLEEMERATHSARAQKLQNDFHDQNKYKKLNTAQREALITDYLKESTLADPEFKKGAEKQLDKNINSIGQHITDIASGVAKGTDVLYLIEQNYIHKTIGRGCMTGIGRTTIEESDHYKDLVAETVRKVSPNEIKGNVALEERQKRIAAEKERTDAFEKRQEGIPFSEADRQKFKELTNGVKAKAWSVTRHKDSEEIMNLRTAVSDVSFAMHERSQYGKTTADADIRTKLLEAYKASIAYQTKVRKKANVSHDNTTWEPTSGYGKERYRAARLVEAYARKYIGPDIKAYEQSQREKDIDEQLGKATEELPDSRKRDTIPKKSIIGETIAAVQTDFKTPKVMNAKSTQAISKQLAHVLAARMVGEIYAPHLDKHGQLPRKNRYSADRYMQDVKTVTKKLQERPDFQNMLKTITVEEAVSLASSPNARRLAVRLGGFTRSMPAETMTAVQNTVDPMLHKQETKKLGSF